MLSALIYYSRSWSENRRMRQPYLDYNRFWTISSGQINGFFFILNLFLTFCGTQKILKTDFNFVEPGTGQHLSKFRTQLFKTFIPIWFKYFGVLNYEVNLWFIKKKQNDFSKKGIKVKGKVKVNYEGTTAPKKTEINIAL